MQIEGFWKVIDDARTAGNDADEQLEKLQSLVEAMAVEDVASFGSQFDACLDRAYRWSLWAAAYIMGGGCSDDAFWDFRSTLIMQGKDVYERSLADPDSLADLDFDDAEEDCFFEGFQYVASQVYETKTGGELPRSQPHPGDPQGEPWDEEGDELERLCPRLWAKYG